MTTPSNSNELIAKDIAYIQKDIAMINANIKELAGVYATKVSVDDNNKAFEDRVKRLEESSNLWKFLSPTFAAIAGSVLTFLLQSYIQNI